jgi:hypothetical protein
MRILQVSSLRHHSTLTTITSFLLFPQNTRYFVTQISVFPFRMLQMTLYLISRIFLSNSRFHLTSRSKVETQTTTTTTTEPTVITFGTQGTKTVIQLSLSPNKIKEETDNEITLSIPRKSLLYHLLDQISLIIEGRRIPRS